VTVDRWMDKENVINEILFSLKKKGNLAIWDNIGEPGGQSVKWNKTDREGQTLHDITYMRNLKKSNSLKQRVE